jgi:hypothetical protein
LTTDAQGAVTGDEVMAKQWSKLVEVVKQWVTFSNDGVDRMGEGKTLCKSIKEAAGVVGSETLWSLKRFETVWHDDLCKVVEGAVDQRHGEAWTDKRKGSLKRAYKARLKVYLTGVKAVSTRTAKVPAVEGGDDAVSTTSASGEAAPIEDIPMEAVKEAMIKLAIVASKYKLSTAALIRGCVCNS